MSPFLAQAFYIPRNCLSCEGDQAVFCHANDVSFKKSGSPKGRGWLPEETTHNWRSPTPDSREEEGWRLNHHQWSMISSVMIVKLSLSEIPKGWGSEGFRVGEHVEIWGVRWAQTGEASHPSHTWPCALLPSDYFRVVCALICSVVSDSLQPHELYSLSGSSVHGILQARMLEWVAIPFSRGFSQPRNRTWVSPSGFFPIEQCQGSLFLNYILL